MMQGLVIYAPGVAAMGSFTMRIHVVVVSMVRDSTNPTIT